MAVATDYRQNRPINPVHAVLLGFPVALFTGALLSDFAYWSSLDEQWAEFSFWLITGGLFAGGLVLLWVLVGLIRAGARRLRRSVFYFAVLFAMWVLGFANAVAHTKDACAAFPAVVMLSAVMWLLAVVAALIGYSGVPREQDASGLVARTMNEAR